MKPFTLIILAIILNQIASAQLAITNGDTIYAVSGTTFTSQDNIINNGKILGTGLLTLNGTTSQALSGNGTFNNLELNNSNGAVISSSAGSIVNITGNYFPSAGVLTTNGNLTLKSSANGTAIIRTGSSSGNYISGKATLERYIPARRSWRLISFPITSTNPPTINQSLQENVGGSNSSNPSPGYGTHITGGSVANGFDQNSTGSPSMKELSGGNWQGITTTNQPLDGQQPYFLFIRGSRANNISLGTGAVSDNTTLRLSANIKQGNQTISVNGSGWKLISNPFPSRINLDNIAVANSSVINRNFKYWDPKLGGTNNVGGYITASYNGVTYDYVPTPVSPISEYAQPFSAFYVNAIAAGNITISESNKCNCGSDNVFRPLITLTNKLQINLCSYNKDGSTPVVDAVMAAFDDRYSNELDNYDPSKLPNIGAENLSIVRNNFKLSIERRKAIISFDTINLNIANVSLRKYKFEFLPQNFNADSLKAFIEDSYTGQKISVNLSVPGTFDFNITTDSASYARNRFKVVLKPTQFVALPVTISKITAIEKNNAITLVWKVDNEIDISTYYIEYADDGINFISRGSITVDKIATASKNYSWVDLNVAGGDHYYRIKIINLNKDATYSEIVKVSMRKNIKSNIIIYPSLLKGNNIHIQMNNQATGIYQLQLINDNGQLLYKAKIHVNSNFYSTAVNIPVNLAKGNYFIEIAGVDNKKVKNIQKIIVE